MERDALHPPIPTPDSTDIEKQTEATLTAPTNLHAQQRSHLNASLQPTPSPSSRHSTSSRKNLDDLDNNNTIWLRIDHIGKYEARFMYYSIIIFSIFIIIVASLNMISGVSRAIDTNPASFEDNTYYIVSASGGAVSLF